MKPAVTSAFVVACSLLVLVLAGCQGQGEAEAPARVPERVENAALEVVLTDVPSSFRLVENTGDQLRFEPTGEGSTGEVTFALDSTDATLNLQAARQLHKDEILARTAGDYKGQNELVTHLGPAYYSRGRYQGEDGTPIEETLILALHPAGGSILRVVYRYPAGEDSPQRLEALFGVLGEIEVPGNEAPDGTDSTAG